MSQKDLIFQIISWYNNDVEYENYDDEVEEEEDAPKNTDTSKYLVKVFGITTNGESISVNLTDFPPYFFIKIDGPVDKTRLLKIRETLEKKLYGAKSALIDVRMFKKKEFYGFTNNELFSFIRFTFKNMKTFRKAIYIMKNDKYKLYESNIEPFLRLMHNRDIDSNGWVKIPSGCYENNKDLLPTCCKIDVTCKWNKIERANIERIAALSIAGFDIECTSSHGDFPVARKNYKKFSYDLYEYYRANEEEDHIKDMIQDEIINSFKTDTKGKLSKLYPKYMDIDIITANIMRDIDEIYSILIGKLVYSNKKPSNNFAEYKDRGERIAKKDLSRDEIITKLTEKFGDYSEQDVWDGILPPLEGDQIIQIGTTIHNYGSSEIKTKHIVTLGTCDKIPGIIVDQCKTEDELLIKWRNFIVKQDPDVLIGYNIFGFDISYMYLRAKELNIDKEFCKIGRIKNHKSEYIVKMLSSSALGDNILKYIAMEGRVLIDMMKVIQRDHKLDSYKLDAVANHFLGGKVISIDGNVCIFDNVKGIKEESYVKLGDHKYKVKTIELLDNKTYQVTFDEEIMYYLKIKNWGLSKDDITPKQIFECQKGTSADRAQIAKYCFVKGTRVSLPSCSVDIKCLENMNTDVISWIENEGFSTSQKVNFFNNGERDCLQLTLIDGTQICCTHDHKFLTKNGWIEAQNLQSTDKILCYPEPAFIDYDTEKLYTFKFSELIGTLDYNKSCIFLRLLGYLLTDGTISESTCYKNYSAGKVKYIYDIACINLGTKMDAINMQKDIYTLIGKSPAIIKQAYTYRITMPQKLTYWFLSIDSVEKGKRLSSNINLPNFIINANCPIWILREFLKGLMGGDGHCPNFDKNTDKFGKVAFSQSKSYDNIDSLINYMKNIKNIFEKFNINSTVSNTTKNASGEGYTVHLNIKQDDMIIFYEKIGYAYCVGKSYKLAVACSYYKLKKETKRQYNWVCERVKILKKSMLISEALKQAHLELELNEPIFNKHYSLPGIKSLKFDIRNNISLSSCKFRKLDFPSIENYLKLTESYDRFVSNDNTKSYSVKQDDTHSPCYYLSILNKKDIGKHAVYDIEVKNTHNFVANGVVVHNCVQDCALCNYLIMKLETIANNIGMANVCSVPLEYIFMRGQGIKIFSLVSKQCRIDDYMIPTLTVKRYEEGEEPEEEGYEGAIVLEPKEGIYLDDPVSVLDYASLYPSSMISENLSHDCIVLDPKYGNIKGCEYLDISYDIYEKVKDKKIKTGVQTCRFVQFAEKGVIPRILMNLLKQRKLTRKKIEFKTVASIDDIETSGLVSTMENGDVKISSLDGTSVIIEKEYVKTIQDTYDEFQKAVLDGLQLAYKVTANSLYGQCGARTSQIYMKDIAACTTATGRAMIMKAKEFIEANYPAETIYGDSVTNYTPVLIRHNKLIKIETIENIAVKYGNNKWIKCIEIGKEDKESCEVIDVETWTETGWTKIHRVIRHQLSENKKIIRINTHTGIVDVTDDHSLLKLDKTEISPKNLKIGDSLLHSPYPKINDDNCINIHSINEARIMGFFCGDGSTGDYKCPSGNKCSWALNNADMKLQEKYKELCEDVYPDLQWKILDTIKSSGVYKLVPCSKDNYGGIKRLVKKYRKLMYYDKEKVIPVTILNASTNIRDSFWKGLYDADGDKEGVVTRIDQKNQISLAMFNLLGDSLGYNTSLNSRTDKLNIFRLNLTKNSQRKDPYKIKKKYAIPYTGYVYDLTTDNHHFQAGIGRLIVHNTDSLMLRFTIKDENGNKLTGKSAIMPCIKMAMDASKQFKKYLKPPHDAEYEKTFYPFILLSKKRYCANKYEFDDVKYKMQSMGIVLKRRDNAQIVKTIYGGVLDIILNQLDVKKSIEFMRSKLFDLIEGKFQLEELIVSKSLKSQYANPDSIAHKVLAERMGERDEGTKPQVNDRIPYIYIEVEEKKGKKVLQGNRIEHPDYIRSNPKTCKPDYGFYISNQIMKPILQVYALVLEDLNGYKKSRDYYKTMYEKLSKEHKDEKLVKDKLHALREKEVQELLFNDILLKLDNKKKGNREITDFFSVKKTT